MARALLAKPDWLFLDEATASLDPEAEAELYRTLKARLPDTTLVSIAHRPVGRRLPRPPPGAAARGGQAGRRWCRPNWQRRRAATAERSPPKAAENTGAHPAARGTIRRNRFVVYRAGPTANAGVRHASARHCCRSGIARRQYRRAGDRLGAERSQLVRHHQIADAEWRLRCDARPADCPSGAGPAAIAGARGRRCVGSGALDQPQRAVRHRLDRTDAAGSGGAEQSRQSTQRPDAGALPVPHRGAHRHGRHP